MLTFRPFIPTALSLALTAALPCLAAEPSSKMLDEKSIERGRYLVKIGGCNDCHTPGYIQAAGQVPESQWLIGSPLGWRGPWGTTYPPNLRRYLPTLSETEWVKMAHTKQLRPPMPWFTLRDMQDEDLRAIYRFVRYLGPAGEAAPAFMPPGQEPAGPYVLFPQPPQQSQSQ